MRSIVKSRDGNTMKSLLSNIKNVWSQNGAMRARPL